MKHFQKSLIAFAFVAIFFGCNTENQQDQPDVTQNPVMSEKMMISMPYVPGYSSSFEMGDPAHATMIVQGSWKDWEDNNLDNMVNWVEDTITAYHSNNTTVHGVDNLMARWKSNRAEYTSVKPTVNAVIPVYSTDRDEHWVLVWATEIDTKLDGSIDTVNLMETWRINKAGKADMLLQYDRATRKN